MRVFVLPLLLATACLTDPPYRPYSTHPQSGYGPGQGQQQPPPPHGPYVDPNSPTGYSNTPTYQTNLNPPPGPQPPPYVAPQGGVAVTPTTAPQPLAPQPLPPQPLPATGTPPSNTGLPASVAGRYQCWVAGAGMYAQSNLGMVTLDFNNSYTSTQNPSASPGTYRVDGTHVLLTGGPLAGYVGALESNQNGPLVRFRVEMPNDPGTQLRVGDHVCYLTR